jgi:cellulose synthase/poly-beta-1,6-N-acetylglucosamine synthase-like glycosyltransferase
MICAVLFWISAFGVFYAYCAYPFVIYLAARKAGAQVSRPPQDTSPFPMVSVLIAAHDEETVIGHRLKNALDSVYPRDRIEIIVASDGSSDGTVRIVSDFADERVRLLDYKARRGKASVLNAAMDEARGDIIVLSDANTCMDPDAIRCLIPWFQDPRVGAVCGRLVLTDPQSGNNADGLYWKYETFLKKQEGRLGALLGSNGAIYAIRRQFFIPIPGNTIIDDFVIPLLAKQRHGCDIIYDCDAIAHEETAPDVATEFRRRSRIGAGGWQAIALIGGLLNPRHGWVAFTFFSHKVMRWCCPFFMIGAFVSNLLLWRSPFYRALFVMQLAFYVVAMAGSVVPKWVPASKLFRVAGMFVTMNAALLVGFFRWVSGSAPHAPPN